MNTIPTFWEWLALREGLWLADKNAIPGMSRMNPFPATQKRFKAITPKRAHKPKPFAPTVCKVVDIPKPPSISRP
jgi:hypothetical protein